MLTPWAKDRVLAGIVQGRPFVIERPYVALFAGNPDTMGANEVQGGGYRRQLVTGAFGEPRDGFAESTRDIVFEELPETRIEFVGIWDAPEGGHLVARGPLAVPRILNARDTFRFRAGMLGLVMEVGALEVGV